MKMFRSLLNAMVPNSLSIYGKNVGQKVDHLKFKMDLIEGLLVKYSKQCNVLVAMVMRTLLRDLQNGIFLEENLTEGRNQS
jgi:hypothetical protein